jgi:hypothetical protein
MTTSTRTAAGAGAPSPRIINVAVDAAWLASQQTGPYAGTGIYMMDNGLNSGSTGEGGLELSSNVNAGTGVAFNVFPIQALDDEYKVQIEGFEISNGTNIFGNFGFPAQQGGKSPYQWLGTATEQGTCTYQIKISVKGPAGPAAYFWWDPYLTCQG